MDQFVPYVLSLAGGNLVLVAAMVSPNGIFNSVLFRVLPAIVAGVCFCFGAILIVGGAS